MATSNDVIDILRRGRTNPDAIQRAGIQYMESMVQGNVQLNSAGTPAISLLEFTTVTTAMQMREIIAELSDIYPSLASNENELAKHMTFKDWIGRWAYPSKTRFIIGLPLHEVLENAVALQDGTGTRKLTIPGMSSVVVSDATFTMQYPIDILIAKHGSITVTYDVSKKSPLYVPSQSLIKAWTNTINNVEMLYIPYDIYQMKVTSISTTISATAGFHQEYKFSDQFLMVRCFRGSSSGGWEEINVTFSDVTYDPTIPTVVAQVNANEETVTITVPQMYLSSGLLRDQIRVDVYTTKGVLDLTLENFKSKSFRAEWKNPDVTAAQDPLGFGSRMGKFTSVYHTAEMATIGGTNGKSFGRLRNDVILRSNRTEGPPISDLQISNVLRDSGFNKTTVIDNITGRLFLATKQLPKPVFDKDTVSTTDNLPFAVGSMGSTVEAMNLSLEDLAKNATVIDNGERLTVLPSTLYELENGKLNIVLDSFVKALLDSSVTSTDQLANIVNSRKFFYTPFFYVHDITGNGYSMRPYALQNPNVVRKYAVGNNDTLGVTTAVSEYSLELMPDYSGWRYIFAISSSAGLDALSPDQVNFQMSYNDRQGKFRTIFNGTLLSPIDQTTGKPVNNKYIFEVIVPTNWDITKDDMIRIGAGTSRAPLQSSWDLVLFVKDYFPVGAVRSTIDDATNPSLLPNFDPTATYVGVSQEQLDLDLGYHLNYLWKRSNSTIEPWMYQRYVEDIPAYYSKTIYETTPAGDPVLIMNEDGTALTQKVLHAEGDPILDENGKPVYAFYKDQLVLDPTTKEPILVSGERGILRNFDMFMLDGKYYFTTSPTIGAYKDNVNDTLVGWNNNELTEFNKTLIDQTRIYYHSTSTNGLIKAYVGDSTLITLEADQRLTVDVVVPDTIYRNAEQRRSIKIAIIETIDDYLKSNTTLSQSELLAAVRSSIANDQIGISIKGLFNNDHEAITLAYESIGPSIGKRLITDSALNVTIDDHIDIDFTRHRTTTVR